VTGQVDLDGYADAGVLAAVALVNELMPGPAAGDRRPRARKRGAIARILAVDPVSVARLRERDTPRFLGLARDLHQVFRDLHHGDIDAAASRLNGLLSEYPAHPHLAKEHGQWRLHHHPMDTGLVPMWSAICAEGMARMIGAGCGDRFGACEAADCGRVFFDLSRNASRRFCSTTCQNRVKAAAFRLRRSRGSPRPSPRTPKR
jgi:predicted RNA-binding Zn ribbon-like protein